MMRTLRTFRVNGDSLRCWFSPEGSLSSAVLSVEESEGDVSSQLPGLTVENAIEYLADLGYVKEHDSRCIEVGREVNKLLEGSPFFVEAVLKKGSKTILSVALVEDRQKVSCKRSFVAVHYSDAGVLRFEAVRNSLYVLEFLQRVQHACPVV